MLWNDPDIGIDLPIAEPNLSPRDADYPRLKDLTTNQLPQHPPVEKI
jgi:hypothetical protein